VLDGAGPAALYDLDARKVVQQLPVNGSAPVQQLPDGSCWLVDSGYAGSVVQVSPDGGILRQWLVPAPLALSVEPDGRYGAVTMRDRITVLDLHTGQPEREIFAWPRHDGSAAGPVLLADGSLAFWSLAAGFDVLPVSHQLPA
jgi:hypothetical protein